MLVYWSISQEEKKRCFARKQCSRCFPFWKAVFLGLRSVCSHRCLNLSSDRPNHPTHDVSSQSESKALFNQSVLGHCEYQSFWCNQLLCASPPLGTARVLSSEFWLWRWGGKCVFLLFVISVGSVFLEISQRSLVERDAELMSRESRDQRDGERWWSSPDAPSEQILRGCICPFFEFEQVLWLYLTLRGSALSDSVCCLFVFVLFFLIILNFCLELTFFSQRHRVIVVKLKTENMLINECFSQIQGELMAFVNVCQFRFLLCFIFFLCFDCFTLNTQPLNFVLFCWKFGLVCFFF